MAASRSQAIRQLSTRAFAFVLAAAWSCGAAQGPATEHGQSAAAPHDACATFLTTTQSLMLAVLEELPRAYGAMAGEVVRIQEVKTNVYEVRVLQEERTDVLTFETSMSPECRARAALAAERVEDSRTR